MNTKTVEFFDEEHSIVIDDQYDTTTFEFFPEDKKFTVSRSVKDDCFYSNQTIEYKLSVNPIELQVRTLESSHEPPSEYSIKDGVVLESEILKQNHSPAFEYKNFIDGLKEEVEWSKVDLLVLGNYEVNLYILSKHPEIVSKNEYRKFLRQSIEKIRTGVLKVEKAVKQDTHGLEISTGEYGKSIWYPNNELEKKEMDEYYDLTEEKRKGTNHEKKLEYAERFNESLFKDDSPNYVGMSKYEYKTSTELLGYLEKLLDQKETDTTKKTDNEENRSYWRWIGYVWTVIINLITIGVILGIYANLYASFEIIVVSILILIYLSLQSFLMIYGQTIIATAFDLDTKFKHIRKLLKDEPSKDEKESIQEAKKKVDNATIKMYINAAFLFIIYLIALFQLFGAL